jgi:pyrroloquinoline quinone biosynthesis protein B
MLVEATPAIEAQLTLLYRLAAVAPPSPNPVDAVLLTHAHIGHYLGLAQFGREVGATRALPVFATAAMAGFLTGNAPWSQLVELGQIRPVEIVPGRCFEPLTDLRVTAVRVPHRSEFSDVVAFRLCGPAATVLFCPDVDRWDAEPDLLAELLEGVDVAYIDGTFHDQTEIPGRDLTEIPHPRMIDTMDRLAGFAAGHRGTVRFIHLNHTNRALLEPQARAALEARGFRCAEEGQQIRL